MMVIEDKERKTKKNTITTTTTNNNNNNNIVSINQSIQSIFIDERVKTTTDIVTKISTN